MNIKRVISLSLFFLLTNALFGQYADSIHPNSNKKYIQVQKLKIRIDSLIASSALIKHMGAKTIITTGGSEGRIYPSDSVIFQDGKEIGNFLSYTHHSNRSGKIVKAEYFEKVNFSERKIRTIKIDLYYKHNKPYYVDYSELHYEDNIIVCKFVHSFFIVIKRKENILETPESRLMMKKIYQLIKSA
jgi:hypothetical protein